MCCLPLSPEDRWRGSRSDCCGERISPILAASGELLVCGGGFVDGVVNPYDVAHRLFCVQIVIVAAALKQLRVRAMFYDSALFDDENLIGCADG